MLLQSCRRETKSGWTNLAKQEDWAPSAWTTNRTHGGCSPNKSQANHSFHTQNMRRRRINEAYIFAGVGEVLKVRVVECLNRRDSLVRLVNKDLFEQITRQGRDLWVFLWQRNSWIVWEALNVFGRLTERIRREIISINRKKKKKGDKEEKSPVRRWWRQWSLLKVFHNLLWFSLIDLSLRQAGIQLPFSPFFFWNLLLRLCPANMISPVNISAKMHPALQRSTGEKWYLRQLRRQDD